MIPEARRELTSGLPYKQKMETRETSGIGSDDSEPPECPFRVSVANEQTTLSINTSRLLEAVRKILQESDYLSASISLAVVDDPTIHSLNRQYLQHDYPTDVLSFPLEDDGCHLEGQLIVSADTAIANAAAYGWSASDELLLYIVHGTLHLVGYRDKQFEELVAMRSAEAKYLEELGIQVPAEHLQVSEESP